MAVFEKEMAMAEIRVGDRVQWAQPSPDADTGTVRKIQKNGRRARVRWDQSGLSWIDLRALVRAKIESEYVISCSREDSCC